MKRYRQFAPVLISDFQTATWLHPVHNHNHFELIYIKHGKGLHHINGQKIAYQPGDLFLLGPDEQHFFDIELPSRFIYLKFTDLYIHHGHQAQPEMHELEYLIRCREWRLSRFEISELDRVVIDLIFEVILELKGNLEKNERLIWLQIVSLSSLLKRNLNKMITVNTTGGSMEAMYAYIHEHIYSPALLKAEAMSAFFYISRDYIGPYFKKNTGIALRDYIQKYRNVLIKKRLDSGHYTLKQVAAEFGLTDESHLIKIMKRHLG